MALIQQLTEVVKLYTNEIELIEQFLKSVEQSLSRKQKRKPPKTFTDEEKSQIQKIRELFEELTSGKKTKEIELEVSDNVSKLLTQITIPIIHKGYLAEMALAYLVSHQEAFIKDYIYQILIHKKDMLKSSSTISIDHVIGFTSIKSLVASMAQKEVDGIGYGSIDDVSSYLERKLNLLLSEFDEWEALREINYRRNLLIHNRGKTNDLYCKKTGYKQKNRKLTTDYDYLAKAIKTIQSFIIYFHEKVKNKLKL